MLYANTIDGVVFERMHILHYFSSKSYKKMQANTFDSIINT